MALDQLDDSGGDRHRDWARPLLLGCAGSAAVKLIILDGLLPAKKFGELVREFPEPPPAEGWHRNLHAHSNKWSKAELPKCLEHWLSDEMTQFVSNQLDIEPLYSDPTLKGGGCHVSTRGSYLDLHTDFLYHPELKKRRAANAIFFVHPQWQHEWGGCLELWSSDRWHCEATIQPLPNRLVLFETSDVSWHGHPEPMTVPEGVWRKSIAMYWYTDLYGDEDPTKSTNYQPRRCDRWRYFEVEKQA